MDEETAADIAVVPLLLLLLAVEIVVPRALAHDLGPGRRRRRRRGPSRLALALPRRPAVARPAQHGRERRAGGPGPSLPARRNRRRRATPPSGDSGRGRRDRCRSADGRGLPRRPGDRDTAGPGPLVRGRAPVAGGAGTGRLGGAPRLHADAGTRGLVHELAARSPAADRRDAPVAADLRPGTKPAPRRGGSHGCSRSSRWSLAATLAMRLAPPGRALTAAAVVALCPACALGVVFGAGGMIPLALVLGAGLLARGRGLPVAATAFGLGLMGAALPLLGLFPGEVVRWALEARPLAPGISVSNLLYYRPGQEAAGMALVRACGSDRARAPGLRPAPLEGSEVDALGPSWSDGRGRARLCCRASRPMR